MHQIRIVDPLDKRSCMQFSTHSSKKSVEREGLKNSDCQTKVLVQVEAF